MQVSLINKNRSNANSANNCNRNIIFGAVPVSEFCKKYPKQSDLIIDEITKLLKICINIDLLYSQEHKTMRPETIQAMIARIISQPQHSEKVANIMDSGFSEIADNIISFNFVKDNQVHLQIKDITGKNDCHYVYDMSTGILSQCVNILIPQDYRIKVIPVKRKMLLTENIDLSRASEKWSVIKELFVEMSKGLPIINERGCLIMTGGKFKSDRPLYIN